MLRMAAKTKLTPEVAIKRALAFFGPGGHGLQVREQRADYICLEGGGGLVEVSAAAEGKGSSLELVSREWDYQLKEFLGTIS
jgi:hypothetical protein